MAERGVIRNRDHAAQIKDFSGLRFGTITPTDVDGLIDFHDRATVLMEFKYGAAILPYGQKLALQRQCDDIERGKKPCLLLIARHHEIGGTINCAVAEVVEYRWRGRWVTLRGDRIVTVREALDRFYARHAVKKAA